MSKLSSFVQFFVLCVVALEVCATGAKGAIYAPPTGGWTFLYDGSALDASWDHTNGSDQWDGSPVGSGSPGGVSTLLDGADPFLRIQDTGNPTAYGMSDPSNRKIYITRQITDLPADFLDSGVTLSFRARLSDTPPLDDQYPDGGGGIVPWPAGGDGYQIHDGGKGAIGLRQESGDKIISFSLAKASDSGSFSQDGLTFNSLNGTATSPDVDTGEGVLTQMLPVSNVNQFHEFWIAIEPSTGAAGTHRVHVFSDGATTPRSFTITAGDGNDQAYSYLAMGQGSTGQSGAVDIDFVAYHPGALAPAGGSLPQPQQTKFKPPPGGWSYMYAANPGEDLPLAGSALDGTWNHDNGSDEWDGSQIGSGRPGGAQVITSGKDSYLRVQDTGDPRDYGMGDPGSNRKIGLTKDIGSLLPDGWQALDQGITLTFRARIATDPPLDDLHPDGGGGTAPWPAGGDGYVIHDGGKGPFGIHQESGTASTISFGLALASDSGALGGQQGLTMNNLNGSSVTGNVDTGEAGSLNILPLADPTAFHEFWVTIQADTSGGGTHRVDVYMDGSTTPASYHVTAGDGQEGLGVDYLALMHGSTGQSGAMDVDFYGFRPGAFAPDTEAVIVSARRGGSSGNRTPLVWPGLLDAGVNPYVDRTHTFVDVPEELVGLDYVQVSNSDKTVGDYTLDVKLAKFADLYLLIDNRVGDDDESDPPTLGNGVMDWVLAMGFEDTGLDVGIDEGGDGVADVFLSAYMLDYVPPGVIQLFAQDDGGSRSMYVVAAAKWTPEPSTWVLLLLGAGGVAAWRGRRRKR